EASWYAFFADGAPQLYTGLDGIVESVFEEVTVGDIMTRAIFSVRPHATIQELAKFLLRARICRALEMDEGNLAGIVTAMDVIRAVATGNVTVEPAESVDASDEGSVDAHRCGTARSVSPAARAGRPERLPGRRGARSGGEDRMAPAAEQSGGGGARRGGRRGGTPCGVRRGGRPRHGAVGPVHRVPARARVGGVRDAGPTVVRGVVACADAGPGGVGYRDARRPSGARAQAEPCGDCAVAQPAACAALPLPWGRAGRARGAGARRARTGHRGHAWRQARGDAHGHARSDGHGRAAEPCGRGGGAAGAASG